MDNVRLSGPDHSCSQYIMCDSCSLSQRFVKIELDASIEIAGFNHAHNDFTNMPDAATVLSPVKCESCQVSFEGCSECGIYGQECTACM